MSLLNKTKIFCISFQRTGTTSVGQFFKDHGCKVAGYEKKRTMEWSSRKIIGDYESIFESEEFKSYDVFEDSPWWFMDFYRVLYHRFPSAKFILLIRESDKWFDSMVSHSNGKTLGNTFRHAKIYRREQEFYNSYPNNEHYKSINEIDNLLEINETHREHYKNLYDIRNKEVIGFFSEFSPQSLFVGKLEDSEKWIKLGSFLNIAVSQDYEVHLNKSKK